MKYVGKQIGGSHYEWMAISPLEIAMEVRLNACAYSIAKYVSRYENKNGLEDLMKAMQCCDIWEVADRGTMPSMLYTDEQRERVRCFCWQFKGDERLIMEYAFMINKDLYEVSNPFALIHDLIGHVAKDKYGEAFLNHGSHGGTRKGKKI